jgi:multimeric flavodoxin WrbA
MKIAVLNGSSKGNQSVTLQYVRYIEKKFPQHQYSVINVSERIGKIEKEEQSFREVIDAVRYSDAVIWAYPIFYLLIPAPLKRFIELIGERHAEDAFLGKYTTVLTTSIHILDTTSHNYMNGICDDLDMKYTGYYSAAMDDLLEEKERDRIFIFADNFFHMIENAMPVTKNYAAVKTEIQSYVPGVAQVKVDPGDKRIVVITDGTEKQPNVTRMVDYFTRSFSKAVEVINLHDIDIKGGCIECLQCAYDNTCVYNGKDGYIDFFNKAVRSADVLVFAGTIRDRYLSSTWKYFFDRSFFNTHIPYLKGKQLGFIISGPLGQLPNLRQIMEAYAEIQEGNPVGFVTDEYGTSGEIDELLLGLAKQVVRLAGQDYTAPRTYLGIGIVKIIRDEMWSKLRFPFQADHKYFIHNGRYDFPHKDHKNRIKSGIMMALSRIPPIREDIYKKKIKAEMIKPLEKIVDKA